MTSAVLNTTALNISIRALRLIGQIDANQSAPSAEETEDTLESLNFMVKSLQSQGLHLWTKTEGIVFLQVGKTDYLLGPDGDEVANLDDFIPTTLASDASTNDTILTYESTAGMEGADDVLPSDPTDSTQGWTVVNGTVSSDGNVLTVANAGGNAGQVQRTFDDLEVGRLYQVNSVYDGGSSPSVKYTVLDGSTVLGTETLSSAGTSKIQFTATQTSLTFDIENGDTAGTNDTLTSDIQLLDTTTGDFNGVRLDDDSRQWEKIIEVLSDTQVSITNGLTGAAATDNSVFTFSDLVPRPMRLLQLRRDRFGSGSEEIETIQWSRQEYFAQPDKRSQGQINNWYYSPQLNNGRLYIWQTANDVDQFGKFTYIRPINVSTETANQPDFPSEWFDPLSFMLAARIGPEYRIPQDRLDRLKLDAEQMMDDALGYDREPDSLNIQPDFQGRS